MYSPFLLPVNMYMTSACDVHVILCVHVFLLFLKVLQEKEKGMKRRLGELEEKSSNTQIDQKREKELEKQVSKYRKGMY